MKNIKKLLLACMMLSAAHCPAIDLTNVRNIRHFPDLSTTPAAQPWRPGWKTAAAALGLTAAGAAALYYYWWQQSAPGATAPSAGHPDKPLIDFTTRQAQHLAELIKTAPRIRSMQEIAEEQRRTINLVGDFARIREVAANKTREATAYAAEQARQAAEALRLGQEHFMREMATNATIAAEHARQAANEAGQQAFEAEASRNATIAGEHARWHAFRTANGILQGAASRPVSVYQKCLSALSSVKDLGIPLLTPLAWGYAAHQRVGEDLVGKVGEENQTTDAPATLSPALAGAGIGAFAGCVAQAAACAYAENTGMHDGVDLLTKSALVHGGLLASYLGYKYFTKPAAATTEEREDLPYGDYTITDKDKSIRYFKYDSVELTKSQWEKRKTRKASPKLKAERPAVAPDSAGQAAPAAPAPGATGQLNPQASAARMTGSAAPIAISAEQSTPVATASGTPARTLAAASTVATDEPRDTNKPDASPHTDGDTTTHAAANTQKGRSSRDPEAKKAATTARLAKEEADRRKTEERLKIAQDDIARTRAAQTGAAAPQGTSSGATGQLNPQAGASASLAAASTVVAPEPRDAHKPDASPHAGEGSMSPGESVVNTPFPSPGLGTLQPVGSPSGRVVNPIQYPHDILFYDPTSPQSAASTGANATAAPAPTAPAPGATGQLNRQAGARTKRGEPAASPTVAQTTIVTALTALQLAANSHGSLPLTRAAGIATALAAASIIPPKPSASDYSAVAAASTHPTVDAQPVAPENRQTLPSGDYTITAKDGSLKYFTKDNTELNLSEWKKRQKRLEKRKKDASASAGVAAPKTPARRDGGTDTPPSASASGDATLAANPAGQSAANTPWHSPEGVEFDTNAELVAGGAAPTTPASETDNSTPAPMAQAAASAGVAAPTSPASKTDSSAPASASAAPATPARRGGGTDTPASASASGGATLAAAPGPRMARQNKAHLLTPPTALATGPDGRPVVRAGAVVLRDLRNIRAQTVTGRRGPAGAGSGAGAGAGSSGAASATTDTPAAPTVLPSRL